MSFVHLRVHTEYSLVDSIIRVEELVARSVEFAMPAVGVTEVQNIYSAIKVYSTCVRNGVKPIIGVEAHIENKKNAKSPHHLVLLCQNNEGYRSLCVLLSKAHKQAKTGQSIQMQHEWLTPESCQGLIALSGAQQGEIGQNLLLNRPDDARFALERLGNVFKDRFYLEISRFGAQYEVAYEDAVLELATASKTPVVATHQPRFLNKDDFGLHEVKVCIQEKTTISDKNRMSSFTNEQYFRSSEEMLECFSDIPGAIDNSLEIAKRCNVRFDLKATHMPAYPQTIEEPSIDNYLERLSREGLQRRLPDGADERYEKRLAAELEIIRNTDYAGYFLIVADIIKWAKESGIPVGPGRGSGAGSLVAYCLDITTVDPIEHDLIFERFLNSDRVSPPDFDIDFCVKERDRIIERVAERYGRNQVAQIITYNTMAAKAAVRDVGRALKPDYLYYDEIARLIPPDLNITLSRALERNSELKKRYDTEPRVKELIDTAQALEGMIRNVSKHPGGIVIAPSEITNFSALFADTDSGRDITHFDKDDLEAIGLVKFDFLGLTTLTVIDDTLQRLHKKDIAGAPASDQDIPLNDRATFKYIREGNTVGIFQLESKGMQRLIVDMQPDGFKDLVALLALYRPGPLQTGMDKMYVENRETKQYNALHEDLKEVLDQSNGVILYQEQVMKIAQIMSGYTMGEADILRYAMGKKVKKEMQVQRERFVSGAVEKGYDMKLATEVYALMESFAGYGFNKSHSVAYAILAYRTAYLKTHHRADFLAACMSVDMKVDTIAKIFNDAKKQKIRFLPPDINRSVYEFVAVSEYEILYGLGALKQVGALAVRAIEEAREAGGNFNSLLEFCKRVDLGQVSKSVCQALITAGAFDSIDSNRARLVENLDSAYGFAQLRAQEQATGQMSLFGGDNDDSDDEIEFRDVMPWSRSEQLRREFGILGIYVSGHPCERYQREFRSILSGDIKQVRNRMGERLVICGLVTNRRVVEARRRRKTPGANNLFFDIEGASEEVSAVVYSENFDQLSKRVSENQPVILVGTFSDNNGYSDERFIVSNVFEVDRVRRHPSAQVILDLQHDRLNGGTFQQIKNVFEDYRVGQNAIKVRYYSGCGARANFSLGRDWHVEINEELLDRLQSILGEERVNVDYSRISL